MSTLARSISVAFLLATLAAMAPARSTYYFDFGDGSTPFTTKVPKAQHTYTATSEGATYTEGLRVTDSHGVHGADSNQVIRIDHADFAPVFGGPASGGTGLATARSLSIQ